MDGQKYVFVEDEKTGEDDMLTVSQYRNMYPEEAAWVTFLVKATGKC